MIKTPQDPGAALEELRTATARLAVPGTHISNVCGNFKTFTTPSFLEQLEIMITGSAGAPRGGATGSKAGSRPPMNVEAMDFRDEMRGHANMERIRITGENRYYFDTAEAITEWSRAAEKHDDEIKKTTRRIKAWIARIDTMTQPPIVKELAEPCWACEASSYVATDADGIRSISRPLVLRVREGASVLECRACGARWDEWAQLEEAGAYVQGKTIQEIRTAVRNVTRPKKPAAKNIPTDETIVELQAYTAKHGHLPTTFNGTAQEKRLSAWIRHRAANTPKTDKAKAAREALDQIMATYPTKRQAIITGLTEAAAA